jgi:hypothetical protein
MNNLSVKEKKTLGNVFYCLWTKKCVNGMSGFVCNYVTDVEGNFEYFCRFVHLSSALSFDDKREALVLEAGAYFVFGGDAVDKGPGDIRVCRLLVALKKKHPDRVFLIVGNRDLNKLRYAAELSTSDLERSIDSIPPPHWDPKAPTLRDYLEGVARDSNVTDVRNLNTRVHRLKYILKHTLGCPQTFEFRREELAVLGNTAVENISDENVVDSCVYEICDPNGSLWQYIDNGSVGAIIGNTLFVHGAINRSCMKYVPQHIKFENSDKPQLPFKMVESVHEWVDLLNQYLRDGFDDYLKRPHWNEDRTSRGGESLMALQNRSASWGRTVVVNSYCDGGNVTSDYARAVMENEDRQRQILVNPLAFEGLNSDPRDEEVAKWLLENKIQRLIVGHKPCGDCPAVLSSRYTGVEVVCGDTSFSDTSAKDNRGLAASSTEIHGKNSTDNHVELKGILRDGQPYNCAFPRLHDGDKVDASVGDPLLGNELKSKWWVKVRIQMGNEEVGYQLSKGQRRTVEYKRVLKREIHAFL